MATQETKAPGGEDAEKLAASGAEDDIDLDEGALVNPKSKLRKILLIAVPVVVLLAGGGAAAFFLGVFGGEGEAVEGGAAAPVAAKPVFFDLPDLLVNINGRARRPSFLKVAVSLELESPDDVEEIEQALPRVVDSFQVYLRELRSDDLNSSAGMMRLREDLLLRVNETVTPAKVRDVLFREMLIQ